MQNSDSNTSVPLRSSLSMPDHITAPGRSEILLPNLRAWLQPWSEANPRGWLKIRWDGWFRFFAHTTPASPMLIDREALSVPCDKASDGRVALTENGPQLLALDVFSGPTFPVRHARDTGDSNQPTTVTRRYHADEIPPRLTVFEHIDLGEEGDLDHWNTAVLLGHHYQRIVRDRGRDHLVVDTEHLAELFDWLDGVLFQLAEPPKPRARRSYPETLLMRDRRLTLAVELFRRFGLPRTRNDEPPSPRSAIDAAAQAAGMSYAAVRMAVNRFQTRARQRAASEDSNTRPWPCGPRT